MNRRGFLGALTGAAVLDPEKLLWVPGRKLISIPAPAEPVFLTFTSVWQPIHAEYLHMASLLFAEKPLAFRFDVQSPASGPDERAILASTLRQYAFDRGHRNLNITRVLTLTE